MAEDSEWVLESLVGFMSSPDWLIPMADFMESKSSVFDDEEENKLSYTEIHQQYKQLVECLLERHMQEVGISEQQFLQACSCFSSSKALQTVFQPVFAADDFPMFRSLMLQKNMELQLQALRVIKQRNGGLPECLTDGVDVISELEQKELEILQEVLKRSKEEYDLEVSQQLQDSEDLASTSSSQSETHLGNTCEQLSGTEHQHSNGINGWSGNQETKENLAESAIRSLGKSAPLPAPRASVKVSMNRAKTEPDKQKNAERETAEAETLRERDAQSRGHSEDVALQQRSEYLKHQRDKLQTLKKEQKKHSHSRSESHSHTAAAEPQGQQEISAEEKKKLQKRKHLAEKLKEEVIKK